MICVRLQVDDVKGNTLRDDNFRVKIVELHLEPKLYDAFFKVFDSDLEALIAMKATDYSLLLGFHSHNKGWDVLNTSTKYNL